MNTYLNAYGLINTEAYPNIKVGDYTLQQKKRMRIEDKDIYCRDMGRLLGLVGILKRAYVALYLNLHIYCSPKGPLYIVILNLQEEIKMRELGID